MPGRVWLTHGAEMGGSGTARTRLANPWRCVRAEPAVGIIYLFIYLNIFNQDNLISNAVFHQGPEKHIKLHKSDIQMHIS